MKYLSPCRQGGSRGLIAGAAVASGQFYSCRAEELNTEHPLQHSPSQTHSQQTLSSSSGLEGWVGPREQWCPLPRTIFSLWDSSQELDNKTSDTRNITRSQLQVRLSSSKYFASLQIRDFYILLLLWSECHVFMAKGSSHYQNPSFVKITVMFTVLCTGNAEWISKSHHFLLFYYLEHEHSSKELFNNIRSYYVRTQWSTLNSS